MDAPTIARPAPDPIEGRARPALELAAAIGLLELELWQFRAHAPAWVNAVVYAAIVGVMIQSHRRRQQTGAGSISTLRAWFESLAACLVLSTTLMVAAALVGDANETFEFVFLDKPPAKLAAWLVGKFLAALGQQLALQAFLWPTCREMTRSKPAGMVLAATLFGLIHLPSPTLVAITTLAGVIWIALYRRSNRLAPLVLSHMILATLAHGGLPERLTYDMRVGSTAMADMKRFEQLNDPHVRLINRRLKDNRAKLRHFTSVAYFEVEAKGGDRKAFVRALIRDILGRPATETEVEFWSGRPLANPRDELPPFFLASEEFARRQREERGTARR